MKVKAVMQHAAISLEAQGLGFRFEGVERALGLGFKGLTLQKPVPSGDEHVINSPFHSEPPKPLN